MSFLNTIIEYRVNFTCYKEFGSPENIRCLKHPSWYKFAMTINPTDKPSSFESQRKSALSIYNIYIYIYLSGFRPTYTVIRAHRPKISSENSSYPARVYIYTNIPNKVRYVCILRRLSQTFESISSLLNDSAAAASAPATTKT